MAEKILIVEDERNIASFVSMYLKNARYQVEIARDGGEALMKAENTKPDLVVLDLMLPDIDGLEVCRQIRSTSDVPILMLTARDDDIDKIVGLEVGADDYLTKPFNPRELVARIKSILRRATQTQKSGRPPEAVMEHGAIKIDAGRREVTVSGDQVQLAPKEFDLLWELLDHRGLVLTRDQLLERVWGYTFAGDTRTVDVHVRELRRKLGDECPVATVWGVGYKALTMLRSLRTRLTLLLRGRCCWRRCIAGAASTGSTRARTATRSANEAALRGGAPPGASTPCDRVRRRCRADRTRATRRSNDLWLPCARYRQRAP